jgi:hypothetical protein
MTYQDFIKSEFSALTVPEVLRAKPSVLLGVSAGAADALRNLRILTVFDLALSVVIDNASRILTGAEDPRSFFRKFGRVPATLVDRSLLTIEDPTRLPANPIEALVGIGAVSGAALRQHLSVATIRDLALWPPYLAAKAILLEAYNPDVEVTADPEAPAALIPKSGDFGSERYLLSNVTMFPGDTKIALTPLNNHRFDITATPDTGFDLVRFGARLTYSQTWFPVRVAKGHLLHSLPLAPGETTNVAVISWSNKSSAALRQSQSESERLSNTMDRARAVSQIADSVATECQEGFSGTATQSTSGSAGAIAAVPFLAGAAAGSGSASETSAHSYTMSSGERTIDTHLRQNIEDTTQQVASSVRGERAAVVSEVSQRQSETLSTRSVTNFNHMHALTIQYYEVVQIYETRLKLEEFERCIFVPMKMLDFTDERNILRYLSILEASALDALTRSLLGDVADTGTGFTFAATMRRFPVVADAPPNVLALIAAERQRVRVSYPRLADDDFLVSPASGPINPDHFAINYQLQLNHARWSHPDIQSVSVHLEDLTVASIDASNNNASAPDLIHPALNGGDSLSFGRIRAIRIVWRPGTSLDTPGERRVRLFLAVKLFGESRWLDCRFVASSSTPENGDLYTISTPPGIVELGQLLMENQLYYSQQIWRRSNPQTLIMQLAPIGLDVGARTINLVDHIAPIPLKIVGNYVVYRFTFEDDPDWRKWVHENIDISRTSVDRISVPTGGVFAEAVLGRFNAAEKLDATRFFDWKDSPPPAPPAISPLKSKERTLATAPSVPELETAAVSIATPLTLPSPTGMTEALQSIVMADLFQNFSRAADTRTAASASLDGSAGNSVAALSTAGDSFAKALTGLTTLFSTISSDKGLSTIGALINQKKDLQKAQPAPDGSTGGTPAPSSTSSATPADIVGAALSGVLGVGTALPSTSASPAIVTPPPVTAAEAITRFRGRSGTSIFTLGPNSAQIRADFANRLDALVADPKQFDQKNLNACGPAAFFHFWLKRDPKAAVIYAIDLFEHGSATIGSLEIAPTQDLLKENYAVLPGVPPTADWIMLSSLRNATPSPVSPFRFSGVAGDPDQDVAGITFPGELQAWLRATGLYLDVIDKANVAIPQSFSVAETLAPDAVRDIIMLMNTEMLSPKPPNAVCDRTNIPFAALLSNLAIPNHWVVLEAIDTSRAVSHDEVTFTFWCWADHLRTPPRACMPFTVTFDTFKKNFFGAVIAVK